MGYVQCFREREVKVKESKVRANVFSLYINIAMCPSTSSP
jgi:hypothetical protein